MEPKERILDRTIFLIGKKGSLDVSVREIAQEADVNVAAINYYFSTKDQMMEAMKDYLVAKFREVNLMLLHDDGDPAREIEEWALEVMKYLEEYPGIIPVITQIIRDGADDLFGSSLQAHLEEIFRSLGDKLSRVGDFEDNLDLFRVIGIFVSSITSPYYVFRDITMIDRYLGSDEGKRAYIRQLMGLCRK